MPSLWQQQQFGIGEQRVESARDAFIQVLIACPKDDPHRTVKPPEFRHTLQSINICPDMSDIIESVGIQKGGIYRHFDGKEAIMLAALEYAMQRRVGAIQQMLVPTDSAVDQLQAICASFIVLLEPPSLPGGCPILNAAVEADDLYPPLREKVRQGLNTLRALIHQVVADGKARSELQPHVNGDVVATLLIATCEGALMMTKLYGDRVHLHRAVDHLRAYFDTLTV